MKFDPFTVRAKLPAPVPTEAGLSAVTEGGAMVNVKLLEGAPSGSTTLIVEVPGAVSRPAGIVTVIWLEPTTWGLLIGVVALLAVQFTVSPATNPLPLIVKEIPGLPAPTAGGLRLVRAGAGSRLNGNGCEGTPLLPSTTVM